MRRMAIVPKGFIRFQVLELLGEKPMSGSELMSEIEDRTGGLWRPSPGSIYPLLTWLLDEGYVRETPPEGNGMKRYALTDKGKMLLEEEKKIKTILQNAETIRLITREGSKSIADLQSGDKVIVHVEKGGRHFGALVAEESIVER